ncbi:hypothetical protein MBLNU230_g2786t1 [Neophaeotheca triangularis]
MWRSQILPAFLALSQSSSAAILYQGATVISYDHEADRFEPLENASLLIEGDTISQLCAGPPDFDVPGNTTHINATDKIISPGFIDTHHHLWQTAYKTIASNTTLGEYFDRYGAYSPAQFQFTPEDNYLGQLVGSLELLYDGTTTVLDHAHGGFSEDHIDGMVDAMVESGVRAVYAQSVDQYENDYTFERQIEKLQELTNDTRFDNDLLDLGFAFDGFTTYSESNVSTVWDIVSSNNVSAITTHYLGGPWSFANSPELLDSLNWLNTSIPVIFSHASFLNRADARLLRSTNQYVSTTPESEQHYGHNHPHAEQIQDQAALGIDTHFTFGSSMVQQARSWLQTLRARAFEKVVDGEWLIPRNNPMSVHQAFRLITRSGGLALRRPDLGIIAPGAKADLVVFDTSAPNMIGWSDPIAAIILHSQTGDMQDVMVGGNFAKRDGKLVYPDYAGLAGRFKQSAQRIQRVWAEREWEPLEGEFQGFTPWADVPEIDVLRGEGTGY